MGLLSLGTPLPWEEAKKHNDHVRLHGINQFLTLYHKLKHKRTACLLWGDEVEYMVIAYDDENKNAKLSLSVFDLLKELQRDEENHSIGRYVSWRPEFGRYMLEGTPGKPYGNTMQDLLEVEPNMKLRREIAKKYMKPNEVAVTVTSFPRLGAPGVFTEPHYEPIGDASRSLFLPDEIINPHARFPTLAANIRKRRRYKVAINMPIFRDKETPKPFIDPTIPRNRNIFPEDKEAEQGAALPDHIYMDAMGFGMGCSCLQITFQACNIVDARLLYDQLATMGPIMLALTAAAPAYRGYLSDVDCRWNVIANSVDDRTPEERGFIPLKNDRFIINKSRYDSIDSYISTDERLKPEYNDIPLIYDEEICTKLMDNGIDELLARHIAHLFIRDPLVVFEELLNQDDEVSSDHFENLQSTNWQTMRFKPPPPNSDIGWRVEFRSMEVQFTDFENAAFAVFIALLTRVIMIMRSNFYIPITKVDENMRRAHKRDAVLKEKFWFRKQLFDHNDSSTSSNGVNGTTEVNGYTSHSTVVNEYTEMTINEIINGNGTEFPGLISLINNYLDLIDLDKPTRTGLNKYLDFVGKRANGTLQTAATWMREFIRSHPNYNHDSVISQEINYDLIKTIERMQKGEVAGIPNREKILGEIQV
ncbi:2456_t:CDS:10 [Ambispora gerdemannii]|uniref:Glutamate--cysteine ligase n=1 Tax=Ambispora gerdemannii TaxID=144530 RepID=A0A9N8VHX4_9GLOM|nr:2456_t:CDS:10 [Ambispora gerdemannii]